MMLPQTLDNVSFTPNLYNSYIDYTDVSETTLKGYKSHLKQFFIWIDKNDIHQPEREDIKAYKAYLDTCNYSAGTKAQYLRAVKQFFKWANSEGLYRNIADNIKGVKVKADNTKKEAFTESDIKTILESINRNNEAGKRDYLLILLSVVGGLRIIEMQRADIQDIQTIKGQKVLYIQGKGHHEKDDYTKLPPEVVDAIEDYLSCRAYKKSDPLFVGTGNRDKGGRLTEPSLSRIIKTRFRQAGFDCSKLTAHSLRHTSNTLLFKAGADLYTVQQHARHTDPKTTEIYIHAVEREKDHSEQDIYNQIFRPNAKDTYREACDLLKELSETQQADVINYIKTLPMQN